MLAGLALARPQKLRPDHRGGQFPRFPGGQAPPRPRKTRNSVDVARSHKRVRKATASSGRKLFSAGVDDPLIGAILRALPQSPRYGAGDELKKPGEKIFRRD